MKKQKDLITLLVPLFILTVLWAIFNIYHNHVTSTIKDPLTFQIIPIEGKFDVKTINKLKGRQKINPLYEIQVVESPIPTPSLEPILTEEPSPELTPTEAPDVSLTPEPEVTP